MMVFFSSSSIILDLLLLLPIIVTSNDEQQRLLLVDAAAVTITARADVGCGFHLKMTGGAAVVDSPFPVGQLDNGQCRAGSVMAPSLFTWFGDAFVDQQGRGCWWTPPTSVLQCDPLQTQMSHGFIIGCNGTVAYNDQTTFWSCQTGDDDQVNIYTQPSGSNCTEITLATDGCLPICIDGVPQSPPPPPPPSSSTDTSSSSSSSSSDSSLPPSSSSSLSSPPPPEGTSPPSGSTPTSGPTVETPTETASTNIDTTSTAVTTTTTPTSSSTDTSVPPSVTPFLSSDTTGTTPTTTTGTATTDTASSSTNTTSSNSSSSSSFTPPVTLPSPPPTPNSCPMDVIGDGWEFPHLMVPVDRANPSTAYGPSSFGQLSPNASTLYSFDIPVTDGARTCSLFFAFPSTGEVSPSQYNLTFTPNDLGGGGEVDFAFLAEPNHPFVTWDSMPPVAADLGAVELRPGNRYVISSFPCPAGRRISFAMREPPTGDGGTGPGTGAAPDTCLYYFQDIVPAPFGLYISKC